MSYPRSPYEQDDRTDDTATECFLCGGHISAGTDPPVCSGCRPEFELECKLSKMMREYNRDIG